MSSAPSLIIVMDTYGNDRIKEVIQRQRGKSDRKTILSSETQLMPKPKDWNAFLYNGENMMELIRFLALYYKSRKSWAQASNATHLHGSSKILKIERYRIEALESCNHNVTDT